ncbi:hypothetical protein FIBSPDRAFT_887549 [Athelia psychrophila]|uniref:Uncharacterized protein n=1 Tax=Athelia psychrophila TaxID=1759441 RepID=A0A166PK75_9AGAM|nr:hypothetical protein FIBSPDRAFT_887549 [Fibularhizoctonia sp. CBS 109695]
MPDNLVSDMLGSASDNVVRALMCLRCSYVAGIFLRDLRHDSPAAGGNIGIAEDDNIGVAAGGNIGMAAGDDIGMAAGNYTGIAAYNNILNLVGLRDGRNDLGRRIQIWSPIAVEVTGSQDIGNRSTIDFHGNRGPDLNSPEKRLPYETQLDQYLPSHPNIIACSHLDIITCSHPNIIACSHLNIIALSYPDITARSYPNIIARSYPDITARSYPYIIARGFPKIIAHSSHDNIAHSSHDIIAHSSHDNIAHSSYTHLDYHAVAIMINMKGALPIHPRPVAPTKNSCGTLPIASHLVKICQLRSYAVITL